MSVCMYTCSTDPTHYSDVVVDIYYCPLRETMNAYCQFIFGELLVMPQNKSTIWFEPNLSSLTLIAPDDCDSSLVWFFVYVCDHECLVVHCIKCVLTGWCNAAEMWMVENDLYILYVHLRRSCLSVYHHFCFCFTFGKTLWILHSSQSYLVCL